MKFKRVQRDDEDDGGGIDDDYDDDDDGVVRERRERGDLRNYGRWKTDDLPGDQHLGRAPGIRYRVTRVAGERYRRRRIVLRFVPVATNALRTILPR